MTSAQNAHTTFRLTHHVTERIQNRLGIYLTSVEVIKTVESKHLPVGFYFMRNYHIIT